MQSFKHIVIVSDLMTFGYFDKSTSTVFSTHCHLFIHDFYANSIIKLQNLGHSDLILFIYLKKKVNQLKNKVNHYSINWNKNWFFSPWKTSWNFQRELFFSSWKTNWFCPFLGRQTGIFKGYLLPLNIFPWKTKWIFQRVYLRIFSLGRQTRFFKG